MDNRENSYKIIIVGYNNIKKIFINGDLVGDTRDLLPLIIRLLEKGELEQKYYIDHKEFFIEDNSIYSLDKVIKVDNTERDSLILFFEEAQYLSEEIENCIFNNDFKNLLKLI